MCEYAQNSETCNHAYCNLRARRSRVIEVDHAHEAIGIDFAYYEPQEGVTHFAGLLDTPAQRTKPQPVPKDGAEAIEYIKRVRRSILSWEWDWREQTTIDARALFQTAIDTLRLETVCERCEETLEDCTCQKCAGCSKKFDSGDGCERCEECESCCTCSYCEGCEHKVNPDRMCSACERCETCCECVGCSRCDRRGNPEDFYICALCSRCEHCCSCQHCANCGDACASVCDNGYCEGCCDCDGHEDGTEGPRVSQSIKFRTPGRLQLKRSTLKRVLGLELELASVETGETLSAWALKHNASLVEDGSIPDKGVEIVASPSAGDIFITDCESLGASLKSAGATVDDTCGLHVHADARDYHTSDLRRLIILYSAVERVMFELVSRTRMGNRFCQACGHKYLKMLANDSSKGHKDFRKALHWTLYKPDEDDTPKEERIKGKELGSHFASAKHTKYHESRYYALNLHTFFFRKTVEFRLHESHLNPEVYTNWALFCGWITDKANSLSERQLLELFQRHATGNGETLLREIMPKDVSEWFLTRLETRRKARADGGSVESTEQRLAEYTKPADALNADIWHTANATHIFRTEPIEGQKELF